MASISLKPSISSPTSSLPRLTARSEKSRSSVTRRAAPASASTGSEISDWSREASARATSDASTRTASMSSA